jgi:hypothetical protein
MSQKNEMQLLPDGAAQGRSSIKDVIEGIGVARVSEILAHELIYRSYADELVDSIVLPRASIEGVRRIEASLIGHDVQVTAAPVTPRTHRLVLGDHSTTQIST